MSEPTQATAPSTGKPAGEPAQSGADDLSRASAEGFRRDFRVEAVASEEKRTIELSFASELPVRRYDWRKDKEYLEVLSCKPEDVDLSRLNNAHPLLLNHDTWNQIGVVDSARVDADGKCRAVVRFSKSQTGTEIWNDVKSGIRRLVSVGYRRLKEVSSEVKDGLDVVRFSWQPYEVSIVSVPADATIGIGRSQTETISQESNSNMSEPKIDVVAERASATAEANKRVTEIMAIARNLSGKVSDIDKLRDAAIERGDSVDAFRAACLEKLPTVTPQTSALRDVPQRDMKKYSLSRAISMLLPGGKPEGLEKEISDEIALKSGKRASGFWLPDEALARNYIAGTNTLGGFLVETQNLGDQFIELLRNKAQVLNLGARVMNLTGPVTIPRHAAGGAVNWVAETVAATLDTGNFTQLTLTPKAVSAFQQYGKQLLMESNPSIDSIIRDDIVQQIALAVDLAAIHGSGSGDPTGVVNTSGVNTVALSASGLALNNATAYPFLVSLESLVAADNADFGALAYLMRPGHRGALKTQTRFSSTDTPVWDSRSGNTPVNGYRAEVTNQIKTNLTTGTATTICSAIVFGNWNELIVANFGATDLVVDPYTLAVNGVVRIIARRWVDVGVRHPEGFAIGGGIINTH